MPVYLRKNVVFTPPSIENISDEDEDDFIQDPEQIRDVLPQPYRMINKLLTSIFDEVWEVVSQKENARIAEQSKIRPPKYDCSVEIQHQIQRKATSLADSGDGRYVFIGLPNGLTVMDATTQKPITVWEEDNMEIVHVKCHIMGVQTYLIITLDDMGTSRLFAFGFDCLFMLKVLNEPLQEGGTKNLVSKCEASAEGDYAGVVLENTSSKETWLEIHKLPRDAWLRELEAIQAQMAVKQEDGSGEVQASESQAVSDGDTTQQERSGSPKPSTPPLVTGNPGDRASYKFTAPNVVLKIRPPPPHAPNSSSSTYSACQKVDSGEVIGTGQSHLLTGNHLELRDAMFDHLHENVVKYLPKEKSADDKVVMPTFHFLGAGRMVPQGLEQPSLAGQPTTLAVWWSGGTHVQHYSLLKTAKDLEHKSDVVWPFSCQIECTAVSPCTVLLAVGLENGTVVLWDRYLGIDRGVISVSKEHPVVRILFLDPAICEQEVESYSPYKKKSSISLLLQCQDGSLHVYNTAVGPQTPPLCLAGEPEKNDEMETILEAMPDVPELVLTVQRNGSLLLKDVNTGANLCQMTLPSTHQLTNPWDPVVAFGAGGQFLYVKGTRTAPMEVVEGETEVEAEESQHAAVAAADTSALFMFQLRSFPSLDPYWKRQREPAKYLVHTTADQRIGALMKERLAQQALRKPRMQMRWGMLRQELDLVHQYHDTAKKRAQSRVLFSASTYKSSTSIMLK